MMHTPAILETILTTSTPSMYILNQLVDGIPFTDIMNGSVNKT